MKLKLTLLTALAFAGGLGIARAEDGPTPPPPRTLPDALKPYDVDGDGKLSRDEWKAYVEANRPDRPRNPWDTDGDGKLSEDEIKAAREAIRKEIEERCLKRFDEADTNDDGFLSGEEFLATLPKDVAPERARNAFNRIDADGDGKISKEEFLKACSPHGNPEPPRGPRPPKTPRPVKPELPGLPELLKPFDLNGDGILSLDEIRKAITDGTWPAPPHPPVRPSGDGGPR